MGREFVATDPMEDQTSSCTCSEASPFNCTCPRADPPLLPTQSMPRPVVLYIGDSDPPLLPAPLNYAPNPNPGVRENIVRASESETSNVEASQRIPMVSMPPGFRPVAQNSGLLRPVARHAQWPVVRPVQWPVARLAQGPVARPVQGPVAWPVARPARLRPTLRYIGDSDPPLLPTPLNYAPNHNPGDRGSENIVRASESETSNVEASQRIPVESIPRGLRPPVESIPRGLRPVTRYIGDRIGGLVQIPDGRILRVSQEFWAWANGRSRLEVQNAVIEDYLILERMSLLSRCRCQWRSS